MRSLIMTVTLSFMSFSALSGEKLTGDQIKTLFSNKTYDIEKVDVDKNKHLKAYTASDGKRIVYVPWKDIHSKRKWWVEGDKICSTHPKRDDYCREIVDVGNGVYHSFDDDGKHRSTVSNFRDGNQL